MSSCVLEDMQDAWGKADEREAITQSGVTSGGSRNARASRGMVGALGPTTDNAHHGSCKKANNGIIGGIGRLF